MTKKAILEHIIDIFYEYLLTDQINLQFIEEKAKKIGEENNLNFMSKKTEYMGAIEARIRQIEIAKEMLKKINE